MQYRVLLFSGFMIRLFKSLLLICVSLSFLVLPAQAYGKKEKAERLVQAATSTLTYFVDESSYSGLWDTADTAKAIVVVPNSYRGGFVFGGAAGNAVMIAKNDDGSWSGPTFLTIGSFSFGLQAGGEVSELVLLVMTNRGKEALLSTSVKLGADITVAAGPVGAGAKAKTADILAFSRSRGLYGGISLEGSVLKTRKKWNRAYYGADVSTIDIVYRGVQDNELSRPLRQVAYRLANKSNGAQLNTRNQKTSRPLNVSNGNSGRVYNAPGTVQGADLQRPAASTPLREEYEDDRFYGAPLRNNQPDQQ